MCLLHHNKTRYNQCKPQNQTVWLTLAIHFKDVVSFKTDFLTRFDGIWRRVSPACCLSSSIIRVSPTSRSITRLPPSCCAIVYCRTSWGSAPPAWWTCRYTWAWLRWETRKRLLLINVYLFVFTGEVKKIRVYTKDTSLNSSWLYVVWLTDPKIKVFCLQPYWLPLSVSNDASLLLWFHSHDCKNVKLLLGWLLSHGWAAIL